MGMQSTRIGSALFSPVQERLLGLLFGQPDRRFQNSELISLAGSGTGAVVRQLQRLTETGLVTIESEGNRKFYRANPASPIFAELTGIAVKTAGIADPLRSALAPLSHSIRAAFIFGSVARRAERASSDVDLMVISEALTYADIFTAIHPVEAQIGRPISPTVTSYQNWIRRVNQVDSFAQRIASSEKIFLLGTSRDTT